MQPFKIRCSAIGKIMTDPKEASPMQQFEAMKVELNRLKELQAAAKSQGVQYQERAIKIDNIETVILPELDLNKHNLHLSEGFKSYIQMWLKEQIYERYSQFTSKYTEKGNVCESDAIEFVAEQLGWGMVCKNCESREDDHITGTPDIVLAKSVEDIKNCWSCFTFPLFDNEEANKGYEWQGIGYMELFKKERFGLHYCLMDAPEYMIEVEARKASLKAGYTELEADFYDDFRLSMLYSHLDASLRLKSYQYGHNTIAALAVRERVELGRKYIKSLNLEQYITCN